jgi:ribosomal protein S26
LGSIVRLLDYIVGRACGQFLPGDPSLFRRKNKWMVSPSSNRDLEDTILKMAEVKKLTSKHFPPDEVKEILMTVEMQCKIRGNNLPLDKALEEFSKKAKVREATDYLKS